MTTKIIGPMCSGKSHKLISTITPRTLVIKPSTFNRDGAKIISRGHRKTINCQLIEPTLQAVKGILNHDTILIDEAQGFDLETLEWLSANRKCIFCGLDFWANGKLTSLALLDVEETVTLAAMCRCGALARYTKWISGDDPVTAEYEPVCLRCWNE